MRRGHFTRRPLAVAAVVAAIALAVGGSPTLFISPVSASGSAGNAPQWFADAVSARIGLMMGKTAPAYPPGTPYPFSGLQSNVEGLATGDAYVDPATGQPWTFTPGQPGAFSTLLQQVSGQGTWLGDAAPAGERERQIVQVLTALGWRVADQYTSSAGALIKVAANNNQHQSKLWGH